ncbi:MAG: hypothetical protein D6679_05000 [Candidatus Hydrogenedentota bacterium]|nr:MAG: hypothetical protein D6679_05000 [Candidatus Hydrogenedentota bacterium]
MIPSGRRSPLRTAVFFSIRELSRRRIPLVGLVAAALIAWTALFAGRLAFEKSGTVAYDFLLSGTFLYSSLLAILLGHFAAADLTRPGFWYAFASGTPRSELYAARYFAGLGLLLPLVWLPWLLVPVFFPAPPPEALLPPRFLSCLLFTLEGLSLFSLGFALAVWFTPPVSLAFAFALWAAFHLHPDPLVFQIAYPGTIGRLLSLIDRLVPNFEIFNPLRYAGASARAALAPVAFTPLFSLFFFLFGLFRFERRDLA